MKKLLAMLGAAGLVVSTSAVLVSCGGNDADVTPIQGEMNKIIAAVKALDTKKMDEATAISEATKAAEATVSEAFTVKVVKSTPATFAMVTDKLDLDITLTELAKPTEPGEEVKADESPETPELATLTEKVTIEINEHDNGEAETELSEDAKAFNAELATAKALTNDDAKYTEESFAAYKDAVNAIEALTVDTQDTLETAKASLATAKELLKEATPPVVELSEDAKAFNAELATAKALTNDDAKYTEESFAAYKDAVNAIEALTVDTQDTLETAEESLATAKALLVETPAEGEGTDPETEEFAFYYQA